MTDTVDGMRVGVVMLPTDPLPASLTRARELEMLGYDHLWTYDHLSWRRYRQRPWHDAIVWLTAVATATSRIRIGTMVTSPNFRHPVTLAKQAMTLDHVSAGRLVLGVGAGGIGFDATVFGQPALAPKQRAARFAEFVELVDHLLRFPETSYAGECYTVDAAAMLPGCLQQPRLPIAVAAAGRRTLSTAARYADAWVTFGDPADGDATSSAVERAVRSQLASLEEACAEIGRDPHDIDRIFLVDNIGERPLASPAAFEDFAGRYHDLGFTDLVVHHPRADDPMWDDPSDSLERIAADVLPGLRQGSG